MTTNPANTTTAAANSQAIADRIAKGLAAQPNHGWLCEENHATPTPATHVWACATEHDPRGAWVFGLCDDHATPEDPNAAVAKIG